MSMERRGKTLLHNQWLPYQASENKPFIDDQERVNIRNIRTFGLMLPAVFDQHQDIDKSKWPGIRSSVKRMELNGPKFLSKMRLEL